MSVAALAAASVKTLIRLWASVLLPRLKKPNDVIITSRCGQQIKLDASEPMTEEYIKEIVDKLK